MKKRNPKPSDRPQQRKAATRAARAEPARIPAVDITAKHQTDRGAGSQKRGLGTHGEGEQRKPAKVIPIRSQSASAGTRKSPASRRRAS
jgi:hypothetical protein